ncbi:M10 family metallopeptidase C-terminal domain-containing protein, partial [Tabrizicola oligotrophica]|nr:hypothetical protein [Tabrizicola oligotrophica]
AVNLTTGLTNFAGESFTQMENLISGIGHDTLTGTSGANAIYGGAGNDIIRGLGGADRLTGQAGQDVLIGGNGADVFVFTSESDSPAGSADRITAGNGAPAFQGAGVAGGDVIDLSQIDADTTVAGNQSFTFGGVGIGRISCVNNGTNTVIRGNTDADAAFEFTIVVKDGALLASAYAAGDFVL